MNAAANGFHCQLRIALSDGITPSRLPALLALCRQEEPEVEVRFFEVPLAQQIKGLCGDCTISASLNRMKSAKASSPCRCGVTL